MYDERTKKQYQSQLNKLESDALVVKEDMVSKQRDYEAKQNSIKALKEKIANLSKKGKGKVGVSEHAIVRYFERVKGFNIDDIKDEILNEEVLALLDVLGDSGKFPLGEHQIIMKNGTVTTIV